MKTNNLYTMLLAIITLVFLSIMLGICLELLRFYHIVYAKMFDIDVPYITKQIMKLHSDSDYDKSFELSSFLNIMLITCFLMIILNCKRFFIIEKRQIVIIHCVLTAILNITIALFFAAWLIFPFLEISVMPSESSPSTVAWLILCTMGLLFILSLVLVAREWSKSNARLGVELQNQAQKIKEQDPEDFKDKEKSSYAKTRPKKMTDD